MNAVHHFFSMDLSYVLMITLFILVMIFHVGVITWLTVVRLGELRRTKMLTRARKSEKKVEVAG